MIRRHHPSLAPLLAALFVTASLTGAAAQNAGRVGAVNPEATGTPPGAGPRTLTIGTNVIYKERVRTSAQGSTQIMFPDSSTLNVGRNSNIVIDEYVYDPKAGTGKMIATVSKGVMRFVGGQISHTAGVTINTPTATLGIRGGVATVMYPIPPGFAGSDPKLAGAKGELVIGHVGSVVIKNNVSEVIVRPGYMTWVSGPNDPIPEPFPVPDALLRILMALLTSSPGQHGGVADLPTDDMAARLGFGKTILADPSKPPGTDPLGYFSIFDAGNALVKNKSQSNQTRSTVPPGTSGPPPGEPGEEPGEDPCAGSCF